MSEGASQKSRSRTNIANLMFLVAIAAVDALFARALHRVGVLDNAVVVISIAFYDILVYGVFRVIRSVLLQKPGERLDAGLLVLLAMVLFPFTIFCLFFPLFLMVVESLGWM